MASRTIPYGLQWVTEEDIAAVAEVLRSDWITQGPAVERFERALASYCGARFAVAVANGTAALHLAALAAGIGTGDEVITSPITFAASANCVIYAGGRPVFADVEPDTICLDPGAAALKVGKRTRGIIPVHFAGHPCDMAAIHALARERGLTVIEDAAHALGATYTVGGTAGGKVHRVGSCAHGHMTIMSFHPVKHLTTGEGGAITTNDEGLYRRLLLLRSHGITRDPGLLTRNEGAWYYEMQELGFNYRLTDFACALGMSQLSRLDAFVARRREIVARYREAFAGMSNLELPTEREGCLSSWHIFPVRVPAPARARIFAALRDAGIGVNVHYIPVHLHPYYRRAFGHRPGEFPVAEAYYAGAITLPLFPRMTDDEVALVAGAVGEALREAAP
jgi:perosamine synthetase